MISTKHCVPGVGRRCGLKSFYTMCECSPQWPRDSAFFKFHFPTKLPFSQMFHFDKYCYVGILGDI